MKKMQKILIAGLGIVLLMLVRTYEDSLFYDPLLVFFETDHTTMELPAFEEWKLLLHVLYRFLLNTAISIAILWVLFRNKEVIVFSTILYAIVLIVLGVLFYVLLHTSEAGDYMFLFYVRRFLIQPLLLFLLAPAFYMAHIRRKQT